MSIDDLIITNNINADQIRYNCEDYNYFSKIIHIYNCKSHVPLHKFWVLIDKCKLIKNKFENNSNTITVALSLKTECIKHIKMVEKQIGIVLNDDKITSLEIISKICDGGKFVPTFELSVDNTTIIFDSNDERIVHINNIIIGSELTMICELSYVLLNSNSFTSHWKAIQLKKIESFDLTKPLFVKLCETKQHEKITHVQTQYINTNTNETIQHNQPTIKPVLNDIPKKTSFAPSVSDLFGAISGLKKTSHVATPPSQAPIMSLDKPSVNISIVKNEECQPITAPPMPKLRHVVTKEPMGVAEMLKQQRDFEESLKLVKQIVPLRGKALINDYKRLKRVKRFLKEWRIDREKKYNDLMKFFNYS